jgi:polyphenol oxidase
MMLPHFVQSALLRAVPGFYHAFQGTDPVPGRSDAERLREVFVVPPGRLGTLRQVHSRIVLEMREEDGGDPDGGARAGDALWTSVPGTGVGIRTADCVPVLIAHPGTPLCAAVHVGWRGLAAGLIGETVRILAGRCGPDAPGRLVAAAGPSAKGCCYEVGEEVCERLLPLPGGASVLRKGGAPGKWMADVQRLAMEALVAAGLSRRRVEAAGSCTVCSPRFHSFRREKSLTGRQLSFIYML